MANDDFVSSLETSIKNFGEHSDKFLLRTSNRLLRKVKLKTPVGVYDNDGQVGGTLRSNWKSRKVGENAREVYNNTEYALMWGM